MPLTSIHPESFSFIKQTLTVLIVDSKPDELTDITDRLAAIDFFDLIITDTARQAAEIIRGRRVHVCLMELDIKDMHNDEFYLSKTFSSSVRFIGISGAKSCSKGGMAIRNGFFEVFDKPADIPELIGRIFTHAIKNIIAPNANPFQNNAIDRSITILMKQSPATVDRWADGLGITTSTLREQWEKQGIPPKAVIFIWMLFNSAFQYFIQKIFDEAASLNSVKHSPGYNKLLTMFFFKRSYWLEIIGRNTIKHYPIIVFTSTAASSNRNVVMTPV